MLCAVFRSQFNWIMTQQIGYYFYQKKVRCQNRQIHKANFLKGGRKKLNQAPFLVKGFRLFDLVEYQKRVVLHLWKKK